MEQEAEAKIDRNQKLQVEIKQKIEQYNQVVNQINSCLESVLIYEQKLPLISHHNLVDKDSNYSQENNRDRSHLESAFAVTET